MDFSSISIVEESLILLFDSILEICNFFKSILLDSLFINTPIDLLVLDLILFIIKLLNELFEIPDDIRPIE